MSQNPSLSPQRPSPEVLDKDGCCAATRWELLRESLNLESEMRELAASRSFLKVKREINPGQEKRNPLVLDRSTSWIETKCQVNLDRCCSRGLKRSVVQTTLILDKLNYSTIFGNNQKFPALPGLLTQRLRSALSDLLAVPMADIGEMRFWPGSVFVEIVVDGGVWISSIYKVKRGIARERVVDCSVVCLSLCLL